MARWFGTATDIDGQKRAEHTIRSLLRISERLNSTPDVDVLFDALAQEAVALVDPEGGVAGLRTPEGMVCKRYFQRGGVLPLDYCWPPMHRLPGWLILHKTPYLTNDAAADSQIVHDLCAWFGMRTALSTPILSAAGDVLGFLEVHNKRSTAGSRSPTGRCSRRCRRRPRSRSRTPWPTGTCSGRRPASAGDRLVAATRGPSSSQMAFVRTYRTPASRTGGRTEQHGNRTPSRQQP